MAEEVVSMAEVVTMAEEVDSMPEKVVDTVVTVEKHVLEENPAPNSGSPVSEHVADIDHRRASVGSKSSTGKPDSVKNVVPSYLRASTGSCHDFCKYGKKHTFEEKPWKQKPKRKPTASSSVDCVLIKVAGEQKKEMVGSTSLDDKSSSSGSTSSGDKTRPLKYNPPSTKKAPSVEPPEVIKKVISSPSRKIDVQEKRDSLAGGIISKTGEKVDQDSDKCKCPPRRRVSLAGDKLSKTVEKAKSNKSPPPRRASLAGDKLSKTDEKADSHSDKSPPPRRASLAGDKLSRIKKKADSHSGKSPPPRRASLAGDKLSRTEKKSDLQSNKCPLPRGVSLAGGKITKTAQKGDQHSIKPTLRKKALTGGDKMPEIKDKADQQSDKPSPSKPKPTQAKLPSPSDNLDGTRRKGEGKSNIKTERKMPISRSVKKTLAPIAASTPRLHLVIRTISLKRKDEGESNIKTKRKMSISSSVKKVLAPIAASTPKPRLVKTVSLERKKSGSVKVASLTKDRTKTTRTPKSKEVPEKTLHVIKVETGSSAKATPHEKDARAKDKYKRTTRSKAVSSEDKHRTPVKLLFRSGKVIELLTPDTNNTPRRLKFRRARAPAGESSNDGSTKQSLNNKAGGKADVAGAEVPTKRVILKRQVVQGKEVRVLLNNVIEETASKLVVSRKSKVKALVGAFETVISLQEAKKNPSSQSPKLSAG